MELHKVTNRVQFTKVQADRGFWIGAAVFMLGGLGCAMANMNRRYLALTVPVTLAGGATAIGFALYRAPKTPQQLTMDRAIEAGVLLQARKDLAAALGLVWPNKEYLKVNAFEPIKQPVVAALIIVDDMYVSGNKEAQIFEYLLGRLNACVDDWSKTDELTQFQTEVEAVRDRMVEALQEQSTAIN
jgi:hypothetical protein